MARQLPDPTHQPVWMTERLVATEIVEWPASPCRPHDRGRRHEIRVVQARDIPIQLLPGDVATIDQRVAKLLDIGSHHQRPRRAAVPHMHSCLGIDVYQAERSQPRKEQSSAAPSNAAVVEYSHYGFVTFQKHLAGIY